jgi:hypothetical protein
MLQSWYFDWTTFWILGGLVLWEGVRRVPAGAVVLRHAAGYAWQVAGGPHPPGWRLVSWLSPLVTHLVLVPGPDAGRTPPKRLGTWMMVLRLPAAVALVALIVGVPLLTANGGFGGLLRALALAFGASTAAALVSAVGLWRMGIAPRTAIADALPLLSPFAAPRAPEVVLARALEGVAFTGVLRALLGPEAYAEWARPVAYDGARGRADAGALLPAGEAAAVLGRPPAGTLAGDVYCARCGRVYLPAAAACRACEGAELVRVAE